MTDPQPPFVRRSDAGGVATVTLDRGDRLNPLSLGMLDALSAEIGRLREDASVRVVVLAGAGKHFCAGHDLAEMRARPDEASQRDLFDVCRQMMLGLLRLPQPVIARVQGAAVAAGCQLVATCDLAVASEKAIFALPGVKSGIFCTTPGVAVARNVSRKRAMEMLLTGDPVDARTAADWGLVNRVVPAEKLDEEVLLLARKIASHSPEVVRLGKRLFYSQVERAIEPAYAEASEGMVCNLLMDDAAEGIDAFLSRRPPTWKGLGAKA